MMYNGIELKLKVNGTVSKESFQPTNGIAQGCPLSPCLYLLCIQGLISLTVQHARRADGIRGIPIPDAVGTIDTPVTSLVSAFADDLCLGLRHPNYLPAFKRDVLCVYERGAGAQNSWPKTFGWHLGPLAEQRMLPDGWVEGRDITCEREAALRYLGTFLGTDPQQIRAWNKRTTERIESRIEMWRSRGMPATREGRCVALRNSILAVSWYLVDNQVPHGVEGVMEKWRRLSWSFFASGKRRGNTNSTNDSITSATPIKQLTLIQDYAEGGCRAPDVENFAAALQIGKLRRLIEPHTGPTCNFVLYWLNQTYGCLRQGKRLLASTCDFLCFDKERRAPRAWRYMLKTMGCMRGPAPSVDQTDASPFAQNETPWDCEAEDRGLRSVNLKTAWSFGEIVMEPIAYNPCLSGWWGMKDLDGSEWLKDNRSRHKEVRLVRASGERVAKAAKRFDVMKNLATDGITHVKDLISVRGGNYT